MLDINTIDWDKIQEAHNNGASQRLLLKQFKVTYHLLYQGVKAGRLVLRTRSDSLKAAHAAGNYDYSSYRTPKFRLQAAKFGGLKPNAGKCRIYDYCSANNGVVKVQGTWELEYAKYLDANQRDWVRNTEHFPYEFEGKNHKYYPDFYLKDSEEYVEVKGYTTDRDRAKWKQFPKKLLIVDKSYLLGVGAKLDGGVGTTAIAIARQRARIKKAFNCPKCGGLWRGHGRGCISCFHGICTGVRKVRRPSSAELESLVRALPMETVASRLGLKSSATVRKWCVGYKLDYKLLSPTSRVNRKAAPKKGFVPTSKYRHLHYREKRKMWMAIKKASQNSPLYFCKMFKTELEAAQFVATFNNGELLLHSDSKRL